MLTKLDPGFLSHLQKNAAWIIMDPWQHQITDRTVHKDVVDMNQWNSSTFEKIKNYLPNVDHWCAVAYDNYQVHDSLESVNILFKNKSPSVDTFKLWMDENNLSTIIYTGFHTQMCILDRPLGYHNMKQYYETFIALDLCCPFPEKHRDLTTIRTQIFSYAKHFNALSE
jgi:nicotinamidase-related amidase